MSLRIVLADDHQMFRHALRALLAREPGFEIGGRGAVNTQDFPLVFLMTRKEIEGEKVPTGGPGEENQPSTNESCKTDVPTDCQQDFFFLRHDFLQGIENYSNVRNY